MKKYLKITILLVTILFLVACNNETDNADTENTDEINISVTITDQLEDTVIDEADYTVEEETVLIEVLEENYEIGITDEGFLTSIEGVSQDENEGAYWLYEVNGEMVNEGVNDYQVQDDDDISLDLTKTE